MMSKERESRRGALPPEKVADRHQARLAIIYVRQSTPQQIERHQESTRLQYALVDRAVDLGWPHGRVIVIDDDLGRSGLTIEGDWHQLLEICALFDTLIADADGVYDPAHYNDRLLLGLKGTMSEAELHILKARMLEGRLAKARRGELGRAVPMGYVRRARGEIALDPDEQAQATIYLVFDLYDRHRTIGKVLRHLAENDIRLPVRAQGGATKGELEWHRATSVAVLPARQPDLCRRLRLRNAADRSAPTEAGASANRTQSARPRPRPCRLARSRAGLHQLGAVSGEPSTATLERGKAEGGRLVLVAPCSPAFSSAAVVDCA
jgi:DNA invertase Pin-like site-specific DNA recombinase